MAHSLKEGAQRQGAAMTDLRSSPLAHAATYPDRLDPGLLFPVDRAPQRAELGFGAALPFGGVDLWTAYELSWLDAAGKPEVAIATFAVPADSPRIVESKSVKLYLAGFNLARFGSTAEVAAALSRDLSEAAGAAVEVALLPADGDRRHAAGRLHRHLPRHAATCRGRSPAGSRSACHRSAPVQRVAVHAAVQVGVPGHRPARLRLC